MPRQNYSNFIWKTHKLPAKASGHQLLQNTPFKITLPIAQPHLIEAAQSEFHPQSVPDQAPIVSNLKSCDWNHEDDLKLYKLHNQVGNKWCLISSNFPGKSDNCVKNHFFSRLRMSLRHLNKQLTPKSSSRPAKMHVIYKIISTCEERFNPDSEYTQLFINFSNCTSPIFLELKNKILDFLFEKSSSLTAIEQTLEEIHRFNKQYKMRSDILKFPKLNRISRNPKNVDSQEEEQSMFVDFFEEYELKKSKYNEANGSERQNKIFEQQYKKDIEGVQQVSSLQTILKQSCRLSEILRSAQDQVQIKMINTSDYLFNDDNLICNNNWLIDEFSQNSQIEFL